MTPPLSVVMPAWNAAATIEETIASLLAQTFEDFELLVVDDASADDTAARVERLARTDRRIRLLRNQGNKGVAGARNTGLAAARGRLLAAADADDVYRPERFALQVACFERQGDIMALGGGYAPFTPDGHRWEQRMPTGPIELGWRFVARNLVAHPTLMFRRELYERYGGYPDLPMAEDFDFLARVTQRHRIANLDEILVDYRVRPDSASHADPGKLEAIVRRIFRTNFAAFGCDAAYAERFYDYCWGARLHPRDLAPIHAANARIMRTLRRRYALSRRDPDWLGWWARLLTGYCRLKAPDTRAATPAGTAT